MSIILFPCSTDDFVENHRRSCQMKKHLRIFQFRILIRLINRFCFNSIANRKNNSYFKYLVDLLMNKQDVYRLTSSAQEKIFIWIPVWSTLPFDIIRIRISCHYTFLHNIHIDLMFLSLHVAFTVSYLNKTYCV